MALISSSSSASGIDIESISFLDNDDVGTFFLWRGTESMSTNFGGMLRGRSMSHSLANISTLDTIILSLKPRTT